jgi:peptide/nickel transport system ATP-binding protein
MIAMMLIARPKLVIADEPTSALDVSVRHDVLMLLDELVRENNSGLLLISHDIRMVAAFCERILVMYAGRVVETLTRLEDATHLYTRGLIAALPDPRHPVRRLKVLDRKALNAELAQ